MIKQTIRFSKDHSAGCVRPEGDDDLDQAFQTLGLREKLPVVVLAGGAGGVDPELTGRIQQAAFGIAKAVESYQAAVLDGGTRFGVMAAMGLARTEMDAQFPLVGVVLAGMAKLPSSSQNISRLRLWLSSSPLDRNHTHFLLVPGQNWGDESPWIARAASILAGELPSVTVLVNGGDISRMDVENSLQAGRPVLAIRGTGRLADELALSSQDLRIRSVAAEDQEEINRAISQALSRR